MPVKDVRVNHTTGRIINPLAETVEKLDINPKNLKRLAEAYLAQQQKTDVRP